MNEKVIQSAQNPMFKQMKKLLSKKGRVEAKQYLVEGRHLVEEALKERDVVKKILVEEGVMQGVVLTSAVPHIVLPSVLFKQLTQTETPQGILALCQMQSERAIDASLANKKVLLLDGIQDPGNAGTICRTADAAGVDVVVFGKGSVDIYNSKALRSAQGSHLHVDLATGELQAWVEACKEAQLPVYGTALKNSISYEQVQTPQSSFALIVGNEGNGVSPALLEKTDQNLHVPIYGRAESLNVTVATGVLLFALQKKGTSGQK